MEDGEKTADSLMLFKKGIKPKWEDPSNCEGGSLVAEVMIDSPEVIDLIWETIVFSIVGQSFSHYEFVNGIRFMDRIKKHGSLKIEMWISICTAKYLDDPETHSKNKKMIDEIREAFGKIIEKITNFNHLNVFFKDHYKAINTN